MTNIKIDKFRRFGFTNTAYITGNFEKMSFYDRRLIKDSNFKFNTQSFSVCSLDDMFNGCENAVFNHTLTISSDSVVESSNRMFKGCGSAYLPKAEIYDSNIKSCESMFEGCYNAKLDGIRIPKHASIAAKMFKNCKTATFDTIGTLNSAITDYSEIFYGCSNGGFRRLSMPSSQNSLEYKFPYAFYGCSKLDSDNINLENISELIRISDYMFYGAGSNCAESFDDCVLNFAKLESCTSMFDSSNFSFNNTFVQIYGNNYSVNGIMPSNSVGSIRRMFYGTKHVKEKSPTIVLGNIQTKSTSEMEESIGGAIAGHYEVLNNGSSIVLKNGITDFSEVFAYSSLTETDLRGISNNTVLDRLSDKAVQDFTSMYEGCYGLKSVTGSIPPYGKTYKNMFYGCKNLEMDIGNSFVSWNSTVGDFENCSVSGQSLRTYSMSSVAGMFNGCSKIYSSNDDFDLVSVPITVSKNISSISSASESECLKGSFPIIRIATKNPISELREVDYDIKGISGKYGIVRYNSYEDDIYDTEGGSPHQFGVYSKYMKYMFTCGFYRFGGFFSDDPTKFFCIIEHPMYDETDGDVTGFYMQTQSFNGGIVPHDFEKKYETNSSGTYWNEFKYSKLYGAKVYSAIDGSFIDNRFVGSYTRVYKERRIIDDSETIVSVSYDMPVTYFDIRGTGIAVTDI